MTIKHPAIFTAQPTYIAAFVHAATRALSSFYPQHIIRDEDGGFTAIGEGDYGERMSCIRGRIVHSVPAQTGRLLLMQRDGGDALSFPFFAPIGPAGHRARQVHGL